MIAFRCAVLVLVSTSFVGAAEPQWIWSHKEAATKAEKGDVLFRKTFNVEGAAESASITVSADNAFDLFLNGRHIGSGEGWNQRVKFELKPLIVPGRNILAVRATNAGPDPAGLAAKLQIQPQGKEALEIVTDGSWKFSTSLRGNWATPEFDDSKWTAASPLGEYGKTAPWGAAGEIVAGETSPTAVAKSKNQERGLFEFKEGDRLVLLGSAFIERMQANGYFELELLASYSDKNILVRNLGWSGDNVWGDARAVFGSRADGFKRLLSDVNLCEPTVILVCYGENEAYAGAAGLPEFHLGFNTLLDALEKTGARLVIATPRKHENVGKPFPDQTEYNANLRSYCNAMQEVAQERELTFVDWYDVGAGRQLTENGIHLTPEGYDVIANDLNRSLGGSSLETIIDFNLQNGSYDAQGVVLTNVKWQKDTLSFSIQNKRSRFVGLIQLSGLNGPRKDYAITVDGKPTKPTSKNGIVYESYQAPNLDLLAAINEKNFLFFNRYRPQNETYLFLFRKHEQGNNAVEIPQFDPLIAEQEKIISQLKQSPKQKFELKRIGR